MKKGYPGPLRLASIFLLSLSLFYLLPPLFLRIPLVASVFNVLGSLNARAHAAFLDAVGVRSVASANILYLSSGAALLYSPYCFGFLTVAGFAILVCAVPYVGLWRRVKWLLKGSALLLLINQMRISLELLIALAYPLSLPGVDRLLYPLLPAAAFFIWRRGLEDHRISVKEVRYAGG